MAKIDIAIPNYQYGQYIRDCVKSVLQQGVSDLRVLIIDNASTDDSVDVARSLMKIDPRISLRVHEKNLGMHASCNEAADWASGKYFLILCADDILAPDFLRRSIDLMDQNPRASFCYGFEVPFKTKEPLPQLPRRPQCTARIERGVDFIEARYLEAERRISCGTVLVRTDMQKLAGHYRAELDLTHDLEILLRLAIIGDVIFSNDVHAYRRLHSTNYSSPLQSERTNELVLRAAALTSFINGEGRALADAAALHKRMEKRLAARAYWWGVRDLFEGRWHDAATCLRYAVGLSPLTAILPPIDFLFRSEGPIVRQFARTESLAVHESWSARG
jgi:glycosyltransferase involved in cell wall biosynthesis